jgi:hypothetical protein
MSAQELADRCVALGFDVPRNTITNLETGRKQTITVQEVAVLARALRCPPVSLLYDLSSSNTEVLPRLQTSGFHASEWFAGREPTPTEPPAARSDSSVHQSIAESEWRDIDTGGEQLHLYRGLFDLLLELHSEVRAYRAVSDGYPRDPTTGDVVRFDDTDLPTPSNEPAEHPMAKLRRENINAMRVSIRWAVQAIRDKGLPMPDLGDRFMVGWLEP